MLQRRLYDEKNDDDYIINGDLDVQNNLTEEEAGKD